LRGLLRCAQCGQRYTTSWGYSARVLGADGKRPTFRYYTCPTRHQRRSYRRQVQAGVVSGTVLLDCDAPAFNAERYERDIWADIEQFIREPGAVLALLAAERHATIEQQEASRAQLAELQRDLDDLQSQRDDILALYRRQRISERDLDRQLDSIAEEEQGHLRTREKLLAALQDQ
jgi:hypothetical protein